nr:CLCA_X family protein [Pseudoalteromonas shioyasakiensis]
MNFQSRLKRGFYRQGPDYRFDDQVDFTDIKETFGFRTMTVGKWVSKEELFIAANLIYDALADLAQILQLPPTAIGLRGKLNFAFGHGGQQHVQAHYNSATHTLALAKNAGGGALAHEWFHAFDHHIATHLYPNFSARFFASKLWLEHPIKNPHPLNKALGKFYQSIFLDSSGHQANEYVKKSMLIDKQQELFYMSMPEELAARCFEACIANHNEITNLFLVDNLTDSELVYPDTEHTLQSKQALDDYFHSLGALLIR